MNRKALIAGAVFGLIAPFVGIYFGLQVSTAVGNILAFPLITLSYVTGQPFGMWGSALRLIALMLSVVVWASIFALIAKLFKRG